MSAIVLRNYQNQLKSEIYQAWQNEMKNVLAVSPTGSGKAMTLCTLAHELAYAHSMPTVIKVHRRELVSQLCGTLAQLGIPHNVIAQRTNILEIIEEEKRLHGRSFYDPRSPITVVSVDTLLARKEKYRDWAVRQRAWILDEAAHQLKDNKWGQCAELFPNALGVGFTATPQRLDKKGLGRHAFGLFDTMVMGPTVRWLIDEGFLSKYKVVRPKSNYKEFLQDDGSTTKDFTAKARAYASVHSQITGDVVGSYLEHIPGKQAILFADCIEAAKTMEQNFIARGVPAKLLTSETPGKERLRGVIDYRDGNIKVLINVDLFDEGFDCLSEDTEVLTPQGWKDLDSIKNEAHCYGWNKESGQIEIVTIDKVGVRDTRPDEKMWTVKSQHIDLRVTEGHRIYHTGKFPTLGDVKISTAKEVHSECKPFAIPVSAEAEFPGVNLSNDEIKILGWYLTDGWLEDDGRTLCISQTKAWGIEKIKTILESLSWSYRLRVRNPTKHNYKNSKPNTIFSINTKSKNIKRFLSKEEMCAELHQMNREQFKILWQSMIDGDGTRKSQGSLGTLTSTRKNHADTLMHMAVIRGFAVMYGNYVTANQVMVYNLRIRDQRWLRMNPKDSRGAKFKLEKSQGELVWCITNRLGTLITRRNGKVSILGNCPATDAVILARPTKSLGKFLQMCGRSLRPAKGKPFAYIIDLVGNIQYHKLPDTLRTWSLDNVVRKRDTVSLHRFCMSVTCSLPFDRWLDSCPFCGNTDKAYTRVVGEISAREALKQVDGDLELLDPETIRELENELTLEDPWKLEERIKRTAGEYAGKSARKKQLERIEKQKELAETIALWAGKQKMLGFTERQTKKRFMMKFSEGITVALSLPKAEMEEFNVMIKQDLGLV